MIHESIKTLRIGLFRRRQSEEAEAVQSRTGRGREDGGQAAGAVPRGDAVQHTLRNRNGSCTTANKALKNGKGSTIDLAIGKE